MEERSAQPGSFRLLAGDSAAEVYAGRQLAEPRPKDASTTRKLTSFRNLDERWSDWKIVRRVSRDLAVEMAEQIAEDDRERL